MRRSGCSDTEYTASVNLWRNVKGDNRRVGLVAECDIQPRGCMRPSVSQFGRRTLCRTVELAVITKIYTKLCVGKKETRGS
jgi:hypothetical protein